MDNGRRSKEEVWRKLDPRTTGSADIAALVKHAERVSAVCPGLIENFAEHAKDGKLAKKAFLDYGRASKKSKGGAKKRKDYDLAELQALFSRMSGGMDVVTLQDLVDHRADVNRTCPDLIDSFAEIDLDQSATISWDELRVFAGGTDEWLQFQLDHIIGLDSLKEQIHQFHRSISLDSKRKQYGYDIKSGGGKYHMIFQGNPGTGKTTLGRIVAALLKRIEITETDTLIEVQRDNLVAGYVGQTATKTQEKIEEAKKGVLFVDEAYRLAGGGEKDFGKEAIESLMGAMNEPPGKAPVMVFAGYPDDMDKFMQANSGLFRRIPFTFDFDDYTPLDLAMILQKMTEAKGFKLAPDLTVRPHGGSMKLATLIEQGTLPEARSLMNGGICERIFQGAKQALDFRCQTSGSMSVEIGEVDIVAAMKKIPPPPSRDTDGGTSSGSSGSSQAEVIRLKSELAGARSQSQLIKAEADRMRRQLAMSGGGSNEASQEEDQLRETCSQLQAQLRETESRLQSENATLKAELRKVKAQLEAAAPMTSALRTELAQVKAQLAAAGGGAGPAAAAALPPAFAPGAVAPPAAAAKYYSIGPRGEHDFFEEADNAQIAQAHASGVATLKLPPKPYGTFEIRFGAAATSQKMRSAPSSGIIQVNLRNQNTRIVEKG